MYKGKITFPTKHRYVVASVVTRIYNQEPSNAAGYSSANIEVTEKQKEGLQPYWGEWVWSLKKEPA